MRVMAEKPKPITMGTDLGMTFVILFSLAVIGFVIFIAYRHFI